MRSIRTVPLLLLAAGVLVAPSVAVAEEIPAPTVKSTAKIVPIPGFPGTGNHFGKGADVETTLEIEGSGYGVTSANPKGGIPPLSAVNVYLPKGTKLDFKHFKKACSETTLKNIGASGCPKQSILSPLGSVLGEVTFGTERVPETASLQAFLGPGNSLLFFTRGTSPVSLEIVSTGHWVKASGKYAWELKTLVPPVATVPGAPLASARKIHIKAGAAIRSHGHTYYYGTVPTKKNCPKGGFFGKGELTFGGMEGGEREFGIPAKTVTTIVRVPCPKH
jgi:hypothetical protein